MNFQLRNSLHLRPKNSATNTASNIASEAQSAQQLTSSASKYTHGASSTPHDNQYSALRTCEDHQYGNAEYKNIDNSPAAASKHRRDFSTSSEDNMILSNPTGCQHAHSPTSRDYILPSSEAYPSTATSSHSNNRMSGMGGGQGFSKKTLRGKQLVSSSRTGAAPGYHHNIDLSNAFETSLPFDQNPSQPLADRFESYREILANLINYLKEIGNQLEIRAKGNKKLTGLVEQFEFPDTFLRQNGLADGLATFSRGDKASSDEAEKDVGHLNDIMSALENLRHELSGKIEEIRHLDSDFQSAIMTELDNTKRSVSKLNDSLGKLEGDSAPASKEDPYLLRHATDRQIEKQIQEEHYLHTAHSQLEETGLELERLVVYEIQKTYRAVAGFHERLSAIYLKTARSIYDGVVKMPTDTEWNHWIQEAGGSDIFLHNVPIRHLSDINYPGRDHPRCVKICEGQLERRGKYLKGFSPGYYVLTKTHLHEFKSRDSVTPVMSLYLPDQSLGSHSANGGENNKFTLKGKQAGGIHAANHNWTFRVQTYNEMLAWYNDIKRVIEPSSHHTGALAAGVLGSHRHERVSSDSSDANELNAVDGQPWTSIVGDDSAHGAAGARADQPASQQQTCDIHIQPQATNLERSAQYQPSSAQTSYPTPAQTAQVSQTDSTPIHTSTWNTSEKLPGTTTVRKPAHETARESTQAHGLVYPAVATAMGAGGADYAVHQYQNQHQGQTQPYQAKAQPQYAQSQPSVSAQQWTRNQPSATSTDSRFGPYHPSLAFDSSDHQGAYFCSSSIANATTAVASGVGLRVGAEAVAAAHNNHKIQQAQELSVEQRKDLEVKGSRTSTERETATEHTAYQLASNDAAYSTEQWDAGTPRDTIITQQPGFNVPVTSDRASNWSTDEIRHSHGRSGPGSMLEPSDHSTGPSNISGVGAGAVVGTGAVGLAHGCKSRDKESSGLSKEVQKSLSAASSLDSYNTIGLDGGVWNPLYLGSKAQKPSISAGSEVSQHYKDEHPSAAYRNLESAHGNVPADTKDKTATGSGFGATSNRPGTTYDASLPMTAGGVASRNTASRDATPRGAFGSTSCHPGSTANAGLPTATSGSAFGTTSSHLGTMADTGLPTTAAGQSTKSRDVTTLCHSNLPGSFPSTEETPESHSHTGYGTAAASVLGDAGAGGLTSTDHKYNQASKARKAEEELKEHQYCQAPGSTHSPVTLSPLATKATTSGATGVPIGGTSGATESSRSGFTDSSKHDYAAKPSTASSATLGTDKYANQELSKIPTEKATKHSEGEGGSSIPGTSILSSMIRTVGLGDAAAALTGNNDKKYQHADHVKSAGKTRGGSSSEYHYSHTSSEALSGARDSDKSAFFGEKIRSKSDNSSLAHPDTFADSGVLSLRGKSSVPPPSNIGGPNPEGGPQFQHSARGMLDVNPKEGHVLGEERPKAWSMVTAAEKEPLSKGELPSDQSPSVGPTNTTEKRRRSASFMSRKRPDGSQHHQVTAAPGQLIPTQSHKATQSQASTVPVDQAKTPSTEAVDSSQSQAFQPSHESHGSSGGKLGGIGATVTGVAAAAVGLSSHGDQVKKQSSTKQSPRTIQASDFAHDPTTDTYSQGQPVAQNFAIQGYLKDDASQDVRDPAGSRKISTLSASKPSGISAGPASAAGATDTTGITSTDEPTKPAGPASITSTTSTIGTSAADAAVQDASKHHHRRGSSLESFGAAAPAPIIGRMKDGLYMPHPEGLPVLLSQKSEVELQKETDCGIASENQIINDIGQHHEAAKRTSSFAKDEFTHPTTSDYRTLGNAKDNQSLSSKIGDKIVAAAGVAGVGGTTAIAIDHVLSRKEKRKKKKKAKKAECKAMKQSSDEDLGQSYASTGPESSTLTAPQSTTETSPTAAIPAVAVGSADADAVIRTPTTSGTPQAYEDTSSAPATIDASRTYDDTPCTDAIQSYDTSRALAMTGAPRTYENTTEAPQAYSDNSCTTPVTAGCAGACDDTSCRVPTSRNVGVSITEKVYDSATSIPEIIPATSTTTGATDLPGIYVTPSNAHRLNATNSANRDHYSIPKEYEHKHEGSSGVGLSATIASAISAGAAALGLTASHEEWGTHKDDEYTSSISSGSDYGNAQQDSWAPAGQKGTKSYVGDSHHDDVVSTGAGLAVGAGVRAGTGTAVGKDLSPAANNDSSYRIQGSQVTKETEEANVPSHVASIYVYPEQTSKASAPYADIGYYMKSKGLDHAKDKLSANTFSAGVGARSDWGKSTLSPTGKSQVGGAAAASSLGDAAAHHHNKAITTDDSGLSEEWSGPWNRTTEEAEQDLTVLAPGGNLWTTYPHLATGNKRNFKEELQAKVHEKRNQGYQKDTEVKTSLSNNQQTSKSLSSDAAAATSGAATVGGLATGVSAACGAGMSSSTSTATPQLACSVSSGPTFFASEKSNPNIHVHDVSPFTSPTSTTGGGSGSGPGEYTMTGTHGATRGEIVDPAAMTLYSGYGTSEPTDMASTSEPMLHMPHQHQPQTTAGGGVSDDAGVRSSTAAIVGAASAGSAEALPAKSGSSVGLARAYAPRKGSINKMSQRIKGMFKKKDELE